MSASGLKRSSIFWSAPCPFPAPANGWVLDVLLDFVPGIGPTIGAGLGAYLAWEGRNLGMSKWQIAPHGQEYRDRLAARLIRSWARSPIISSSRTRATSGSSRSISTSITRRADDRCPGGELTVPLHKFARRR
jgi:hypothetical protein